MFDDVATRYDLTNLLLTGGQDQMWRRVVTRAVVAKPGPEVLDIAAGTGASASCYERAGARVTGVDFSAGMVAEGRRRYPHLKLVEGDAMALPFPDESFDVATISFGLRNVADPGVALAEMHRVVKPGGKLVVCEFSTPPAAALRGPYHYYLSRVLPAIARVSSSNPAAYDYLAESILAWPDQRRLAALIQRSGWRAVAYRNLSFGIVAVHRARKPAN